MGVLSSSNLSDVFTAVDKAAFIAHYSDSYDVLFVKQPRYFKGYRTKYLRFNVLNRKDKIVVFKTDDVIQLVEFLK